VQFPSATLIRLYEFLKNSRLIKRSRSTTKKPHARAQSRFGVENSTIALGPWWRMTGSNRRPPACKAGALPAELIPHDQPLDGMVGLGGLEPPTPALSRRCSNQLSYRPKPAASPSTGRAAALRRRATTFQQPISVGVQIKLLFPERR